MEKRQYKRRAILTGVLAVSVSSIAGCIADEGSTQRSATEDNSPTPVEQTSTRAPDENRNTQPTNEPDIATVKREAKEYPYRDLMRNSEQYEGRLVHFPEGKITQVLGDEDRGFQFRVYVTPDDYIWDDDILIRWSGERFLEDDIVEMWGRFNGLITYETVAGSKRTIPDITVYEIELLEEAGATETPTPEPSVEILDSKWTVVEEYDYSDDRYGVVGTVENTSDRTVSMLVRVRFLDSTGAQIGDGMDIAMGVPPGERFRFEIAYVGGKSEEVDSYDIDVETRWG
ncbi:MULTISPECIES: FxLYD domain-containing protein [Haloferax]|uniref:Uncharacterized protein n=1 Tax=Haloferax marinum TaxID=2666143 RepID=A0A6A8GEQ7_9EURY|nr:MULTISPECIES: FxLYD domain-containing protein [Haloferax]KAB1190730.1 hypothetical protein Hfx1150_17000 [Haloferax sp. CBA1150]MRW98266.1 hypothetical protein [Haloferax marinum]